MAGGIALHAQDGTGLRGAIAEDLGPASPIVGQSQPDSAATATALTVPPLRDLDPATTGTVPAPRVDAEDGVAAERPEQRAQAIERLARAADETPFAPVGIRAGAFILRPSLEQGVTATDNANSSIGGGSAVLSETTLRLNAESDWSSHSATIDAIGTLRRSLSGEEIEDGNGAVDAAFVADLGKEYRALATLGYAVAPESASSPVAVVGAEDQPYRQTLSGSLGFEKALGKATFTATGRLVDDRFGDATLVDGSTLSQADRDATLYAFALRGAYEVSPALKPFVEGEIGRRIYGTERDATGFARSSDRLAVKAGLEFDRGEKLSGELAAGYVRETLDDPRLRPIDGPTIEGVVNWSPQRGTTVALSGSTVVEGTNTPGESGSLLYSTRATVDRLLRADLTATGSAGYAWRDYVGMDARDRIFNADLSLTYWLNRNAGLTGRLRHERLTSDIPGRESETNSVYLGLRVQR